MKKSVAVFLLATAACGGAPAKSPAGANASNDSSTPIREAPGESTKAADRSLTAPTAAAPAPPAQAPSAEALSERSDDRASGAIGSAIADFERAATSVRGTRDGSPDCKSACRSLLSMERAASHLCALTRGTREDFRCGDAENRVRDERKHVKATCGSCPIGQSLDPNAPLPPP